jgi:hypothetical protein
MLLFVTEKAEPTHGRPFATDLIIGLNAFCFLSMFLAWPVGEGLFQLSWHIPCCRCGAPILV